jgi:hypothetical protein
METTDADAYHCGSDIDTSREQTADFIGARTSTRTEAFSAFRHALDGGGIVMNSCCLAGAVNHLSLR